MEMFSKEDVVAQHVKNIQNNMDEYDQKSKKKATRNTKYIQNLHSKYMLHAKIIEDIDNTYSEI